MVVTSPRKAAWPVSWIMRSARRSRRWADSGRATSASLALMGAGRLTRSLARGRILSSVPQRDAAAHPETVPSPNPPPPRIFSPAPDWVEGPGKRCSSRIFMHQEPE